VDVVEIWVDTAMSLSGRNRRLMAYLAAAQERRWEGGGGDAAPLSAPRPAAQRAAAGAA